MITIRRAFRWLWMLAFVCTLIGQPPSFFAAEPPVTGSSASSVGSLTWPVEDRYHNPNLVIYDRTHLRLYVAEHYGNRKISCGVGPQCEVVGNSVVQFRTYLGAERHFGVRFKSDQLREFLEARIAGTTKEYVDDEMPKITPYERDIGHCISLLAAAHDNEAIAILDKLLSDKSAYVRSSAIVALGSFGGDASASIPKLMELFDGKSAEWVARSLARMGQPGIEALTKKSKTGSEPARLHAIEQLGNVGPVAKSAVKSLIETMQDFKDRGGPPIGAYAAIALGKIGDPRAIPHLRQMKYAKNHDVVSTSAKAIEAIEAAEGIKK